jgi:hypothetical protein
MRFQHTVAALTACLPLLSAGAQETGPAPGATSETPAQTVTVHGVRDPAMAPYADAYDMLTKVREAGGGKVGMAIRILSAKSMQPIPDLELSLQGRTISEKLPLSPDGFLEVPLDKRYLDDKAEFLTNKKNGAVRAEFYFVPVLPKDALTYGDIAASIAAAKETRAKVLPWYFRLLTSGIEGVRLCYPDKGQEIGLSGGAARPAASEQKNVLTKTTVYCAAFGKREVDAAQDTVVMAPPGWVALYE